jgi:hypothetical protein
MKICNFCILGAGKIVFSSKAKAAGPLILPKTTSTEVAANNAMEYLSLEQNSDNLLTSRHFFANVQQLI